MINGAHSIIYSENPEADRAFFREVLGLPHVDTGEGYLIFGLPPAEVAIHDSSDSESGAAFQLYLMTHDVEALVETLDLRGTETTPIQDSGWGLVTEITLPGGGKLAIYQPRHERPDFVTGAALAGTRRPRTAAKKSSKKGSKKAVKKVIKRAVKTAKAPRVSKPTPPSKVSKTKATRVVKASKAAKKRSR